MITSANDNRLLEYELLGSYPELCHFVTTRPGGCSTGNYSSFNCYPHSGDSADHIHANQQSLLENLPRYPQQLIIPFQTHGREVAIIDALFLSLSPKEQTVYLQGKDAVVTVHPGICICVSTADCVPILLYDKVRKVIGAVHAGWRGTVGKTVLSTLRIMHEKYGSTMKDIVACIGPSISKEAYEVGREVYEEFQEARFPMHSIAFLNKETQKYHIDLWKANELLLTEAGLLQENIEVARLCTYTNFDTFFSARKLGIKSGRMLSGIMLYNQ
ncbi:MAG: peptidoglycan editing factor PgeF [Bacteroides sp.]|nr:peptidoglycan editing factor PgeF [Bacteroides sp.]